MKKPRFNVPDTNREFDKTLTFGQRMADRVAAFGGSWAFIGIFGAILIVWIALNVTLVSQRRHAFDPYPFILLNLVLSTLAALQAPVIMMSQNRQSAKDRLDAQHDYEINVKAEIEIEELHANIAVLHSNIAALHENVDALHAEAKTLHARVLEVCDRAAG